MSRVLEQEQALIWSLPQGEHVEIVSLSTGVTIGNQPSAYCKAALFASFTTVAARMQAKLPLSTYNETKTAAKLYASASKMFKVGLRKLCFEEIESYRP